MKLAIEKVVYGGSGLAHADDDAAKGQAIFVPFTLPNEVVEATLLETHNSFSEAKLEEIVTPSSNRVAPPCVHFGSCGGCQYQHAGYETQLELKQQILRETLERAGLPSLPSIERHSAQPWEYRNRIRLRVATIAEKVRLGYLRRGSTEFLPIQMCPIAAPVLWRTAEAFLDLSHEFASWMRATEEVEFFTTADEQKIQMTLFVRIQPDKGFNKFCEALQKRITPLVGAGVQIIESSGRGRKSLRVKPGTTWGSPGLNYQVAGEAYWVSRSSFFQVNRFLIDRLIELATAGHTGKLAWDLYAGVGLFSRVLAKNFTNVVAVEAAATDLASSFKGEGKHAVTATTLDFLRQAVLERDRPDLIIMDPPRAGVGAEVCALLARVKAPEIVYVSCDPSTLGRDLRAMVDSGYKLKHLHLVDMFPQTFHQETIAILVR